MRRVTAYANRFIQLLKRIKGTVQISPKEISKLEQMWIKYIQSKYYFTEKRQLNVEQKREQNPTIHDDGIRVHGRLQNAEMVERTSSPVLTPRKGHFIKLFIEDNNCRFHHGGTSHILAQQRPKMWTPQSHTEVKSALRQYFIFIKHQEGPYKAKFIVQKHWLKSKVIKSKAFFYTGLDYLNCCM